LLSREPNYDFILVLQPTSPLRTAADISNSISILHEKQADAVISVAKTDPPPHWSGAIGSDLSIANFISTKALVRSQDLEDFYHLNGAIYLNRIERLYEEKTFLFRSNSYAYIMPRERSVDIDEEIDLIIAEAIYSHSQKQ
jgi:CMP-N-acetylneuraminic acid synthetase